MVGAGSFLTEVSGGDLVIVDGDQGHVILQPDEATLRQYRAQAEQDRSASGRHWKRFAICPPRPPMVSASSCSPTSSFRAKSTPAWPAAPTASDSTAPNSCI